MSARLAFRLRVAAAIVIIAVAAGMLLRGAFFSPRSAFVRRVPARCDIHSPIACAPDSLTTVPPELISYRLHHSIPLRFENLRAVSLDSDNRIWVGADSTVARVDTNGGTIRSMLAPGSVHALAFSENDRRIFAALRNSIVRFDSSGTRERHWVIPGKQAWLTSLAVDGDAVYAADAGSRIVWRFDTAGTFIGRIGERDTARGVSGFIVPSAFMDIAIGRDGSLWIVNPGRHRVENFRTNGDYIGGWGESGAHPAGFSGCCGPIHMALLPDGRFVTSEKGIARIKIHDQGGAFVTIVAPPAQFNPRETGLDLSVSSDGTIYTVDSHAKLIRVFAPAAS